MRNAVDVIKEIAAKLTFIIELVDVIDNGGGNYTLTIKAQKPVNVQAPEDPIYWLRPKSIIEINGTKYKVETVDDCNKITVKLCPGESGTPAIGETYTLAAPFWFNGTPIAQNQKLKQITDQYNKLPFIYLVEIMREVFDEDPESAIEVEAEAVIYFLDTANFEDWDTDKHYLYSINPMRNLAETFILLLKRAGNIARFDTYTLVNHAKFGVFTTDKGKTENLFNDELSGVELNIDLPILEDLNCLNNC